MQMFLLLFNIAATSRLKQNFTFADKTYNMRLLITLIILLLMASCATTRNNNVNLKDEVNDSIRDGFGKAATYYLD